MATPDTGRHYQAGQCVMLQAGPFAGSEATVIRVIDSGGSLYVVIPGNPTCYTRVKLSEVATAEALASQPGGS